MAGGRRVGRRFATNLKHGGSRGGKVFGTEIDWIVAAEPSLCGERRVLTAFLERGRHFDAH